MLLSRVLIDNNSDISNDGASPATHDQSNNCTSDIEEEIAAVSNAYAELISDDEEDLDFLCTV